MSSPFSRSLPSTPSLAQQKKQAKELLQSFTAGDPEARARIRAVLPDKQRIALADAQFVLAREYGFADWSALKQHIDALEEAAASPSRADRTPRSVGATPTRVRRIFQQQPALAADDRRAPLLASTRRRSSHCANDAAMVDVLLELGADPNRRSEWWAGPFHALHVATGDAAARLLAAGAIPDACAAAHLDRVDLLARMIDEDPARVHERGGDGQTPLHFAQSRAAVDLLLDAWRRHRRTRRRSPLDARRVDARPPPRRGPLRAGALPRRARRLHRHLPRRGARPHRPRARDDRRGPVAARPPDGARPLRRAAAEQPSTSISGRSATAALRWTSPRSSSSTRRSSCCSASPSPHPALHARLPAAATRPAARAVLRDDPTLMTRLTADDRRAITDAAWHGEPRAVALMLDLGFDPRTPGHDSGTALHCAAWQGSPETVAALLRHPDAAELWRSRTRTTARPHSAGAAMAPASATTGRDHAAVARLLLAAGARTGPDTAEASEEVEAVLAGG